MSTTTLYAVHKADLTTIAEYQNSHGTALAIWGLMCKRYLTKPMYGNRDLWDLATDSTVAEHLRITHAATFDYAMIPAAKLEVAAAAFEKAHDDIIRLTDWTWNHWSSIAADLRKLAAKPYRSLIGAGVGCTSVRGSRMDQRASSCPARCRRRSLCASRMSRASPPGRLMTSRMKYLFRSWR